MFGKMNELAWKQVILSIVFIAAAVAVEVLLNRLRDKIQSKIPGDDEQTLRKKGFISLICNIVKVIFALIIILTVLQINGINVTSLIASLGIAGAIAGLAWQDMFRDAIQGLRIITDGFFSVGDCVKYNGSDYLVTGFTIRTTKMKNVDTLDTISVCNRNINEICVLSGILFLNIGLSYNDDPELVNTILDDCSKEIKKIKGVKKCIYAGTNAFNSSTIDYLLKITCSPLIRGDVRRASLAMIQKKLAENGLKIPFNQIDVHMM